MKVRVSNSIRVLLSGRRAGRKDEDERRHRQQQSTAVIFHFLAHGANSSSITCFRKLNRIGRAEQMPESEFRLVGKSVCREASLVIWSAVARHRFGYLDCLLPCARVPRDTFQTPLAFVGRQSSPVSNAKLLALLRSVKRGRVL